MDQPMKFTNNTSTTGPTTTGTTTAHPITGHPTTTTTIIPTKEKIKEDIILKPVHISKSVLSSVLKSNNQLTKNSLQTGFLFGFENNTTNTLEITYSVGLKLKENFSASYDEEFSLIKDYLKSCRLDYTPLGIYLNSEKFEISNSLINNILDLQTSNRQIIFLHFDRISEIFSCRRIKQSFWNRYIDHIIEDEEGNFFNRQFCKDIFDVHPFKTEFDVYSSLSVFDSEVITNNSIVTDGFSNITPSNSSYNTSNNFNHCTYKRIAELNRLSDRFIEEQKKYQNYYKVKRTFGKEKQSDFKDLVNKKIGEFGKFDKNEIGILSYNIKNGINLLKEVNEYENGSRIFIKEMMKGN